MNDRREEIAKLRYALETAHRSFRALYADPSVSEKTLREGRRRIEALEDRLYQLEYEVTAEDIVRPSMMRVKK
jgi:hypothetical protein